MGGGDMRISKSKMQIQKVWACRGAYLEYFSVYKREIAL